MPAERVVVAVGTYLLVVPVSEGSNGSCSDVSRATVAAYRERIRSALEAAFEADHTPHEVGASFAIGLFITALPTLGTGLLAFVVLAAVFDRISKIALFASVVVMNPALKPAVYLGSYRIGNRLLGAEPVVLFDVEAFDVAFDVTLRLVVGNVLLALCAAIVGYAVVRRLTVAYRRRDIDIVDRLVDS